ncbi:unnamed protein product [Zymoseptoria tritici ST99CH_1E4]|uniref:Shugoshin N-terminal coiled-coil domain-containing protein n=1 Tax=Zymoseptoria tritici ST99CH_1E4 TaxID=1276532 RepID=A0A2H1H9N0_ZYMTR|nr:unnamed protein product [Zymoseptoria tritici ST99CH_1E4]
MHGIGFLVVIFVGIKNPPTKLIRPQLIPKLRKKTRNWSNIIHRHRTMLHPPKPRTREDLLRQNRELTKDGSAQSLQIESLELEIGKLLWNNLELGNECCGKPRWKS